MFGLDYTSPTLALAYIYVTEFGMHLNYPHLAYIPLTFSQTTGQVTSHTFKPMYLTSKAKLNPFRYKRRQLSRATFLWAEPFPSSAFGALTLTLKKRPEGQYRRINLKPPSPQGKLGVLNPGIYPGNTRDQDQLRVNPLPSLGENSKVGSIITLNFGTL